MLKTVKVPQQFEPVFLKAQDYVARFFRERKEDPTQGTIEIAGERYILVRAASMSVDFFEIIAGLYEKEGTEEANNVARQLLFDIAHAIGKQDARNFHKKMNLHDPIEKLSAGPIHFAHAGWAFVDIFPESSPSPDESYYLIYDHPYSFESAAWLAAGRKPEFPVCIMNAGYSSGWCEESFGLGLVASEIMCRAKGDAACRFIMAPPARIEAHIAAYLRKEPELAKAVTRYEVPGFFKRKEIEAALHESEKRFRAIFDNATDGILLVDIADKKLLLGNATICRMLGYAPEEIGNLCVMDIHPEKELPYVVSEFERHARGNKAAAENIPVQRKDGSVFYADITAAHLDIGGKTYQAGFFRDITDRKNTGIALRESEERFRQAFQHSAIGMALVGLDGRWLKVNDALCQIVGFSEPELLSMTFQDITHPDDLQTDLDFVRRLINGEIGSYRMEKRYLHQDGHIVWILLSVSLVRDSQGSPVHFVSKIEDINARKLAAQVLADSELKFRTILDAAVDGILVADARTHSFVTANRGICDMLGYSREELYALGVEDIHPTDSLPDVQRQFERQAKGELRVAHDLPVKRKDGTVILADVSSSPMVLAGQPYLVGVFHDVTERKRVEQEIRTYADELTRTNSELQALNAKLEQAQNQLLQSEKMASIGMLAAGVAHEINNPVGFIKSNMQSLEKYVDDLMRVVNAYEKVESLLPEHQDSFSELHRMEKEIEFDYEKKDVLVLLSESRQGLERVTKIVQDLKDFSHVESQSNWIMDNIHKGLDSTLNVVWNELKYTCEVKKEYGELPPVECVLSQLNQVFMNLLVNAAQAIETKGTITIRTGTEGDMVWIEIADTGKGIAPENIGHVFDPFFTTKPVGKGTGLGLSVSYSIVQKHQGRIAVESEVGKGTTFRVWLPIRQTPDDD